MSISRGDDDELRMHFANSPKDKHDSYTLPIPDAIEWRHGSLSRSGLIEALHKFFMWWTRVAVIERCGVQQEIHLKTNYK